MLPQRSQSNFSSQIQRSSAEAMKAARLGNKYLTEEEPWKLMKTDPARVATIMQISAQVVGNLGVLLEPFLPRTAAKIAGAMGISESITDANTSIVAGGTKLGDLPILFAKMTTNSLKNKSQNLEINPLTRTLTSCRKRTQQHLTTSLKWTQE